jgi:succinyl-diaminopimelate desuccinylase
MSVKDILSKVDSQRKELAEVCSQLIQRPSAHPEGRTVECVAYIKQYFDDLGIPNEVHKRNDDKPNIVGRIKGTSKTRIMWVGHLDVVPEGKPENWTYPPYSGKITEDGYIWGRGSSDMKGACAAAMVAARVLSEVEEVPNNIDFWFTADEEVGGGDGAHWLAQEHIFEGDVCIIGDGSPGIPNSPAIDLGCKGGAGTRLIARGKTAHGSRPFLGDNAIDKLLMVVPNVRKIADYRLDVPSELELVIASTIDYMMEEDFTDEQKRALQRLFHHPSVTLNILNGGVKTNVVPDYAEAYFDIRLTPGSNPVKVRERITELVEAAGVPGVTVEFRRPSKTAGYYESPDIPFARQLADTVERTTDIQDPNWWDRRGAD